MTNKDSRNTILYLVGLVVLLGIMFFLITRFSESGFGIFDTSPEKSYATPPTKIIDENKNYQAIIHTNLGDIKLDLLEKNAPTTVNNFVFLARDKFYDQVKFHRIVKDFIIQTGSRLSLDNNPSNDGLGGPGYRFADENNWDSIKLEQAARSTLTSEGFSSNGNVTSVSIEKYAVAMANAGPNTNGSQFFIVTGETDSESIQALRGKHTVFAKVLEGQSVVEQIDEAQVDNAEAVAPRPVTDIVINSVEILEI